LLPVVASSPELEPDPELEPELVEPELPPAAASSPLLSWVPLDADPPHPAANDAPHAAAKRTLMTLMKNCPPVAIPATPRREP
jgi:hypothetical protein